MRTSKYAALRIFAIRQEDCGQLSERCRQPKNQPAGVHHPRIPARRLHEHLVEALEARLLLSEAYSATAIIGNNNSGANQITVEINGVVLANGNLMTPVTYKTDWLPNTPYILTATLEQPNPQGGADYFSLTLDGDYMDQVGLLGYDGTVANDTQHGFIYLGGAFNPDAAGTTQTFTLFYKLPAQLSGTFTGSIPSTAQPGDTILPALQITDAANDEDIVDGNETTVYYLSTTPNLVGIITPALATNSYTLNLDAGDSYTESKEVTLPSSINAGTYYLVAEIDADQTISSNDVNDFAVTGPIQIEASLSAQFTGSIPSTASPGATISPGLQITDAADAADVVNGNETTEYYLSTTPDLTGIITPALATNQYTLNLDSGDSHTESQDVTIPDDVASGTYYLVAQIDANQTINPDDTDNFATSGPIQIGDKLEFDANGQPSDIMLSYPSNTGSFSDPIVVDVLDANGSVDTSDNSTVTLSLDDTNGKPASGVTLLGTLTAQAVGGVATFSGLSVSTNVGSPGGDFTLEATDGSLTAGSSNQFTVTSLLTLANMSNDVYMGDDIPTNESGYSLLPNGYNTAANNSSYAACAYANSLTDPTQIVVAFQGTVLPTTSVIQFLKGIAADASFTGSVPSSFLISEVQDAAAFVGSIQQQYGSNPNGDNVQITLTGHSLGGAVAQLLGEAGGLPAYTFNAPGAGQLFNALSLGGAFTALGARQDSNTNINYRVWGEQISLAGTPTGATVTLPDPVSFTPILSNPVVDLMTNVSNYIGQIHALTTILSEISSDAGPMAFYSEGASSIVLPNEPDDVQSLESLITPTSTLAPNGYPALYNFIFNITNAAGTMLDPNEGADFILTEQERSPAITSITFPSLSGVSSYNVRYETMEGWSNFGVVQPGTVDNFASGVDGIEFLPLGSNGQDTEITGPFLFDLSFASTGTFSGSMVETATPGIDIWTGSQSSSWNNSNNWSNAVIPNATTNALIGGGMIIATSPFDVGSLSIVGGTLQLGIDGGNSAYSVSSLAIADGGTLDVGNNELLINYGAGSDPISSIAAQIESGYNSGAWNGAGIISSAAAFAPKKYGIGFADSADPGNPAGLASGQIEIKYTLLGDANLDGVVNGTDFSILAQNFGQGDTNWDQGNFLFTSSVNGSDFSALAANFGQGVNLNPPGITPTAGAQYTITGAPGSQIFEVLTGTVTLSSDLTTLLPNYTLQIQSGAVVVLNSDQHLAAIQLSGTGTIDARNYTIWIDYGSNIDPIATLAAALKSGYNNGDWNGSGIISSTARTPTNGHTYALGWADGKDGVVAGLSSGQIEIKYTLLGDANLDGIVNGADFSILAAHFGQGLTNWDQGNFLYGSAINGADFSALAANFGQGDSGAGSTPNANSVASPTFAAAVNKLETTTANSTPVTDDADSKLLAKR
jgi:Lipase (class 3)